MIIKKSLNIISGVFFSTVIILSMWSLVPIVSRELDSHIAGIFLVAMLFSISAILSGVLEKISIKRSGKTDIIFCIMTMVLLVMQIIFALCQNFSPRNDLSYICQGAENIVIGRPLYENIPEIHKHYFEVYPNNHALLVIICGLYRIEYLLTGNITNTLPVAVNIISLNLSYVLMYMTAKLIYTPEKAFMCAVRGMMFTPLITYTAFFYTDSMAMLWVSSGLYLYIKWRSNNTTKDILCMLICGVVIAVAYKIKGSAFIIVPAIIVDVMFLNRKGKFIYLGLLITAFVICSCVLGELFISVADISRAELERYRFPLIHWIMMSADGRGGYCAEDFRYTLGFDGAENKVTADITRLCVKLSQQGMKGFTNHIVRKIAYTWRDGTYMAGYYNGYPFLKSYGFYIFAEMCHFTVMSGIVRRCFSGKDTDSLFVLRITFTGLAVFLIIWETRCRYLVSFFVLFALL